MPTFRTWLNVRRRFLLPASILVFFLIVLFARTAFFHVLQFVQRPLVSSSTWMSNQYAFFFGSCQVKQDAYKNLITQRDQFAIDRVEMESLKRDNERFKNELGFLQQKKMNGLTGAIVSRSVSNQTSTFIINKGANDHVVLGAPAIVENGMFVGKVTRVDKTQSVVTASTDFQLATGVSLLNKTRTIGIAQGTSGNLIEIKFIPIDEQIRQNDLVVTSGLENDIPSGLIVGIVNTVQPDAEAPFQHAIVEPLADVRRYDHVIILIPSL